MKRPSATGEEGSAADDGTPRADKRKGGCAVRVRDRRAPVPGGRPDASLILLAKDEAGAIGGVAAEAAEVLERSGLSYEILVVDDGSVDGTCDAARSCGVECLRVLSHPRNLGRSFAIATGLRAARGEAVVLMDGDGQYDPRDVPALVAALGESDVVTGRRDRREDPWVRRLLSWGYNHAIVRGLLRTPVRDQNSGLKAFTREAAQRLDFRPEGFSALHRFLLVIARKRGLRIVEVPIRHRPRQYGRSYIRWYSVPFVTIADLARLLVRWRRV